MALPTTVGAHSFPNQNYFVGPFISSAGNVYVVVRSAALSIQVYKATDPTSSFATAAASWDRGGVANWDSVWVYQVADVLHIVGESAPGFLYYRQFDMASDAWVAAEENITSGLSTANKACSIAVRSDGVVVVAHGGATESVMGSAYQRVV